MPEPIKLSDISEHQTYDSEIVFSLVFCTGTKTHSLSGLRRLSKNQNRLFVRKKSFYKINAVYSENEKRVLWKNRWRKNQKLANVRGFRESFSLMLDFQNVINRSVLEFILHSLYIQDVNKNCRKLRAIFLIIFIELGCWKMHFSPDKNMFHLIKRMFEMSAFLCQEET